jgi:hypothetical protein
MRKHLNPSGRRLQDSTLKRKYKTIPSALSRVLQAELKAD